MIRGIGVDICDVDRMEKAISQKGFIERVFSPEEAAYSDAKALPAMHYASAFAAREALAKATGWGIAGIGMDSCYVRRTEGGPRFVFSEEFERKLKAADICGVFLSLSHEAGIAVAVVVLEGTQ